MKTVEELKHELNVLQNTAVTAKDKKAKARITDKVRLLNACLFIAEKCVEEMIEAQLSTAQKRLSAYERNILALKTHGLPKDAFAAQKKDIDQKFSPNVLKHQIKISKYLLQQ